MATDKNLIDYTLRHKDRKEFFHSSGYAHVQNRDNFGAAGGDSFEVRQKIDKERKHVENYRKSKLGNSTFSGFEAKTYSRSDDTLSANNPMDVAMNRARFSSSGGRPSASSSDVVRRAQPILSNAKAPRIPSRLSGIFHL